jgi:hypothetical protein
MDNKTDNFQESFIDVAIKKMEDHGKRIDGLEEKAKNQPDHSKDILQLKGEMSNVNAKVNIISFPVNEMNQLSVNRKKQLLYCKIRLSRK